MHIGFLTDALAHLTLDEVLDKVKELGLTEVEIATGNWSNAPHIDLDAIVDSPELQAELQQKLADRGLALGALNASGNVLDPATGPEQAENARKTVRLAQALGITKIVMMSGLPPVNPTDLVAPWIVTCWPAENVGNREKQWETAIAFWREFAAFAADHGIERLALEMHGDQLAYNAPTLLRLRAEIGDIIGANMDPSHLMWMGADPIASVRLLGDAIYHVHAKDTKIEESVAVRTRLETSFFDHVAERSWNYVTLGEGHPGGTAFWRDFVAALAEAGYDGVLSIEHEDESYSPEAGLTKAVSVLEEALA